MFYIQRVGNGYRETVDAFGTRSESVEMLAEYRLSDRFAHFYISSRPCGNWKTETETGAPQCADCDAAMRARFVLYGLFPVVNYHCAECGATRSIPTELSLAEKIESEIDAGETCTTCDGTGETEYTNEFGHVTGYGPCAICDGRGTE